MKESMALLILTGLGLPISRCNSGSGVSVISDTTDIAFQQVDYANETVLSAAHGYVETLEGVPGATGINIPEEVRENGQAQVTRKLTDWISGNAMAVYYFNHPQGVIDTQMKLTVKKDAEVSFRITLWDPVDATETIQVIGTTMVKEFPKRKPELSLCRPEVIFQPYRNRMWLL